MSPAPITAPRVFATLAVVYATFTPPSAPLYWPPHAAEGGLGGLAAALFEPGEWHYWQALLLSALPSALCGTLLFRVAQRLGAAQSTALTVGLGWGLCTVAFPTALHGHPLAIGACLLAATILAALERRPRIAGLTVAALAGLEPAAVLPVAIAALGAWKLAPVETEEEAAPTSRTAVLTGVIIAAVAMGAVLILDPARATASARPGAFTRAAEPLLFGARNGLFWFTPAGLIGALWYLKLARERGGWVAAFPVAALLLVFADAQLDTLDPALPRWVWGRPLHGMALVLIMPGLAADVDHGRASGPRFGLLALSALLAFFIANAGMLPPHDRPGDPFLYALKLNSRWGSFAAPARLFVYPDDLAQVAKNPTFHRAMITLAPSGIALALLWRRASIAAGLAALFALLTGFGAWYAGKASARFYWPF